MDSNASRGSVRVEPGPSEHEQLTSTRDRVRLFALAALTIALIGLCVLIIVPFFPAITWAIALAIIAWPIHRLISRHISRPSLAAVLTSALVVVVILGLGLFVTYQVVRETAGAAGRAQEPAAEGGLRERLADVPGVGQLVAWMDRVGLDVETETRKIIEPYARDLSSLAHGSVTAIIQFLVVVFILYYLFRDHALFLHGIRDILPLSRAESDQVFSRAADSVHANLYATLVTSLIDATGGALMFWVLGLPSPVLWGLVMFVLSILPVVGAGLIWAPTAAYLALTGRWLAGGALLAWGVASFLVVDNVIYVRLAGARMRMHEVPALIAFLGGLAVFGMSGMIIGPAVLAITAAFFEVWRERLAKAYVNHSPPHETAAGA